MKAMLFYGPEDLRFQEVPIPKISSDEVLVKIDTALTGGTDLKTYLRGHPRIIKSLPSSFGYEFSGIVAESLNQNFANGDRVVAGNTAPCFSCFFCLRSEFELCENLEFLNGSFAEYIKIPAQIAKHNLYKIPNETSFEAAACTQTLAVVLHGFYKSQIKNHKNVLIFGLGAIGQTFIKTYKTLAPDTKIFALGKSKLKTKLAYDNGADCVLDYSNADIVQQIKSLTDGHGVDLVIEAVGKPEAWEKSLSLVRPGGVINFFGGCPQNTKINLDTFQAHYQELTTVGVFHHTPFFMKTALDMIASKKISMANLITHNFNLCDLEQALKLGINGEALKICIKPQA
jgi:L-iditol 2-dehydrogenase